MHRRELWEQLHALEPGSSFVGAALAPGEPLPPALLDFALSVAGKTRGLRWIVQRVEGAEETYVPLYLLDERGFATHRYDSERDMVLPYEHDRLERAHVPTSLGPLELPELLRRLRSDVWACEHHANVQDWAVSLVAAAGEAAAGAAVDARCPGLLRFLCQQRPLYCAESAHACVLVRGDRPCVVLLASGETLPLHRLRWRKVLALPVATPEAALEPADHSAPQMLTLLHAVLDALGPPDLDLAPDPVGPFALLAPPLPDDGEVALHAGADPD